MAAATRTTAAGAVPLVVAAAREVEALGGYGVRRCAEATRRDRALQGFARLLAAQEAVSATEPTDRTPDTVVD